MRARLTITLLALMAVVLICLGVPLATSIASGKARAVHADQAGDLAVLAALLPADPRARADSRPESQGGVLAVASDLQRYDRLYDIAVWVTDTEGDLWVSSRAGPPPADAAAERSVRTALAGEPTEGPARIWPWSEGDFVITAHPLVRDGDVVGAVASAVPAAAARAEVLARWVLLAALELVALIGAAILARRLADWLLRPIGLLDVTTGLIAAGDLSARVPVTDGPKEMRSLGTSFNEMAGHVQTVVEAQRTFVADASHQLRNPLAALLLRLEGFAAQMTSTSAQATSAQATSAQATSAQQGEAARRALADGRYLADTLDRMLALAQAEHTGTARPLDVAELVGDRIRSWDVVARSRSIALQLQVVGRPGLARHERAAVSGALDAVLDNSLKYSPAGGTVQVDVRAVEPEGPHGTAGVDVTVTDDGPGVPSSELPLIADRFYRGSTADLHPGPGGTGLGLAIAKTLLELHGGSLEVAGAAGGGMAVRLLVPTADNLDA